MKSTTSFINKGVLYNDFKRYGWTGVVYLLAWLAALPLQLVMIYSRPEIIKAHYNAATYLRVFEFDHSPVLLFLLLMAPVLTGLLVFRYLQTGIAADMEHSLPIRRETLYNTHLLAGLVFLLIPIMITALVTWGVVAGLKIDFVQGQDILDWLKIALIASLLFFLSAVAVGMITGLSTLQGLLTYILLLVPSGLSLLVLHNLQMYVYGFAGDFYMIGLEQLTPLLRLPLSLSSLQSVEIIAYLLMSAGLYLMGGFLYRHRQIEAAGEAITFGVLRPIFKYSVTFCTMLLAGSYFYRTQQSIAWTYWGYFLGAALGYILIEILFHKSVHIFDWRRFKGLGVYALIAAALLGLVHSDFTGYEKRLPQIDQLENVYMDNYFHPLLYAEDSSYAETRSTPRLISIYVNRDNIAHIVDLHREIIAQREEAGITPLISPDTRQERICLAYQFKDGKKLYRYYAVDAELYKQHLKPIYESLEYKNHKFEVLRVNPVDAKLVDIRSQLGNKRVSITDPQLIQEAIAVLQNDVKMQTYEEMSDARPPWGYIEITLPKTQNIDTEGGIWPEATDSAMEAAPKSEYYNITLPWEKSYLGLEGWLQSKGLYSQARLLPSEDIVHAIIEYAPQGVNEAEFRTMKADKIEAKPGQLKVTEADKIELCFYNYQEYAKGAIYKVFFQLKNGTVLIGILTPSSAPDFVKQHFAG